MRQHSRRILPAKRAIKSEAAFLKGVAGGKAPSCSFGYFPSMGKVPRRKAKHNLFFNRAGRVSGPYKLTITAERVYGGSKPPPYGGYASRRGAEIQKTHINPTKQT